MSREERYVSDYECNWGKGGDYSRGIPVGKNKKQKKGEGHCFPFQCFKKLVVKNCFSIEDQY